MQHADTSDWNDSQDLAGRSRESAKEAPPRKSGRSHMRMTVRACASALLIAAVTTAAPISILAGGSATSRATRLAPRYQAEGGVAGRTDAPAASGKLDELAADAERGAYLDALVKQLDSGAPFSLEETRILRRYASGGRLSTYQADVVISRALYAAYVTGEALSSEQAKVLGQYRLFRSRFETGILDAKASVLAAEAVAGPRPEGAAPSNDAIDRAETLSAASFPVRSTLVADVSGAKASDAELPQASGEPVSRVTWYAFTPETTGVYLVSTSRAAGNQTTVEDTVLAIYTAERGGDLRIVPTTATTDGFDDDSAVDGDLQSLVRTTLEAGTRYVIAAGKRGANAPTGGLTAVQVSIDREVARTTLASDTCAGATALLLNTPVNDTTVGATNNYQLAANSPCFTANGAIGSFPDTLVGPDVVYTFTAPTAGTYSFRVKITDLSNGYDVAIYTASACPSGTGVQTVSCLAAADRQGGTSSEEIKCQPLAAGQQVFVFVDSFLAAPDPDIGNPSGPFELEVINCPNEAASNNTPATAGPLVCGQEGSVVPLGDIDFFQLGTPATGSRVFAMVEGGATNGGNGVSDFDLRVTTTTTTLEYDDDNDDFPYGSDAPNVAGAPLTGVASFLRVTNFSTSSPTGGLEPYRIVSVVQPPIASATAEAEPNNTTATANGAVNNYFSGALVASDTDIYAFPATAGDLVYLGLDGDPLRNNTPINGALALLDGAGAVLIAVNDGGSTSNVTAGATLTSTTPNSPAEGLLYRIRTTGFYYARVTGSTTAITGDYLLSISKNCQTGGGGSPAPSLTLGDVTQAEGNAGTTTFNFPVTLSAPAPAPITVTYSTADVTATAGSDYVGVTSGVVTIPMGAMSANLTVTVNGDTTVEPDETFTVTIASAPGATITDGMATGTITNDDATALSINDVTLNEGNVGTTSFVFTVSLSAASASTVTVTYATADGTATAGSDYTATSGTLTFAPTVTAQTVTVLVTGDTSFEPNETFFVNLASPTNATIADGQGLGTITNDDGAAADLATTLADSPDPVVAGSNLTYTITATNNGPEAAATASVSLPLPAGTTFVSASTPSGWTATTPTVGTNGIVTYSNPSFAVGSATFTVVANVSCSTFGVLAATANSTSATTDPTPGNNMGTAMTTVTNAAPTVTCPANVTTPAGAGSCGAVVTYTTPTATDDTGCTATVACTPASGSTFAIGTTTVTCTATDAANQTGTCSFTVTVNDTQAPTVACPANITTSAAPGMCSAAVTYTTPTASDNCAGAVVACVPASGSTFQKGTTTVVCTATDGAGNTGSCSFTVTVNDTQAPTIVCPANISVPAASPAGTTVSYATPTASDNCAGTTVVCSPTSGSVFTTGTTTVVCTATDAAGSTASCSFTVTVGSAFTNCFVDDASGDVLSINTDPGSMVYRAWQYRVAATGQIISGSAESISYYPGRSLVAYDHDTTIVRMDLTVNYSAKTATATVKTFGAGGRTFTLRDRNTTNNSPCQ